jgi:hypothetical protein
LFSKARNLHHLKKVLKHWGYHNHQHDRSFQQEQVKLGLQQLLTHSMYGKKKVYLVDDIDIVSMDLKLPSSTGCNGYWDEHVDFLRVAWGRDLFLKTVISHTTSMEDIVRAVEMICKGDPSMPLFLQPNYFDIESGIMARCQEFQEYCLNYLTDVRIVPQMHKFMGIR